MVHVEFNRQCLLNVLICSRVRIYLKIGFDMFPHTPKLSKKPLISFRIRAKRQNCRGYVPSYERTPKNGRYDIHSVFATHVETVVLLTQRKPDMSIEITMTEEDLELTRAEGKHSTMST